MSVHYELNNFIDSIYYMFMFRGEEGGSRQFLFSRQDYELFFKFPKTCHSFGIFLLKTYDMLGVLRAREGLNILLFLANFFKIKKIVL